MQMSIDQIPHRKKMKYKKWHQKNSLDIGSVTRPFVEKNHLEQAHTVPDCLPKDTNWIQEINIGTTVVYNGNQITPLLVAKTPYNSQMLERDGMFILLHKHLYPVFLNSPRKKTDFLCVYLWLSTTVWQLLLSLIQELLRAQFQKLTHKNFFR